MSPKSLFQKDAAAVARLSSLFEKDLFGDHVFAMAMASYTSRLKATNANDALLMAGKLEGAREILAEIRSLYKITEEKKPTETEGLNYAITSSSRLRPQQPATPKPGPGRPERAGLNPP